MSESCPCCSGLQYNACCQPYLTHAATAAEPAVLMRSRYTAYVKHDVDYLIATWHPDLQPEKWRASLAESCQNSQWLGLTILATSPEKRPMRDMWNSPHVISQKQTASEQKSCENAHASFASIIAGTI